MIFLLVRDSGREPAIRIEASNGMNIGRAPENACLLTDPNVGRYAARIVEDSGKLYVEDLGSTNRTAIRGGRRLAKGERELLRHGTVIELGRSSLEVEDDRSGARDQTDLDATNTAADTNAGDATDSDAGGSKTSSQLSGDFTMVGGVGARPSTPFEPLNTMRAEAPKPKFAPPPRAPQKPVAIPQPAPAPRPAEAPAPAPVRAPPVPPAARAVRPAAVARPVPAESPSVASGTADSSGFGSDGGTQSIRPMSGDLGAIGALLTRKARLVIVNEAIRRIEPIVKPTTLIGREGGEIRIDHPAISHPHAVVRFVDATLNFQIEDRKSKNQTFVAGLALNPGVPQLLTPECLVLLGPIEAVFVVERDSDNTLIPLEHYAGAIRYLLAHNQVTPEQARSAQEQAKQGEKHAGEVLMMAGVISARIWTKAFDSGRLLAANAPIRASGSKKKLVIAVVALLLVGALAWVFRAQLGIGGS